jgi:methylmalonyl-CoA/ethylmalonyl-CoA epimerase
MVKENTVMISRIDHVSIAVRDYEAARTFFEHVMGAVSGASAEDSNLEYFWHMFTVGDMSRLELITPSGEDSFLKKFLKERDGGVHHITLETPDIHKARKHLEEHGVPYFGFTEGPEIWSELYIHPKDAFGVLIQICQLGPDYHLIEPVKRPQGTRWRVQSDKDGIELSLHHPGGVELKLSLDKEEARDLARDLEQVLDA